MVPGERAVIDQPAVTPPTRPRRHVLWWTLGGVAVSLVAVVIAAFNVRIQYYEFHPGSTRPTSQLVVADEVDTYPPAGDIAFTTVSLRRSTLGSYVLAWFDSDVEVVEERQVLGDRSPDENRQFNLQLMDTSKQDAIRVALLQLGYDVPVRIDGVVVLGVEPGSPAEGVLERGDTIVSIDGEELALAADTSRILSTKPPGTDVVLGVEPPDRSQVRQVPLQLAAAPDDPDRGFIGVTLQARNPIYDFPFPIDIESGNVGGPSAGLAFTLGVLDVLTPGELTGGLQVAATGTIDGAGTVGQVGGVPQKTAAVIDAGYDVFLVPSAEYDEALERAGDAVQVIAVDTLSEALDALASLGGSGLGTTPGSG